MAKQSLKRRIDALVDALGAAEKPSPKDIRNELVPIGVLVESLESGQALAEKEATIAALEEELGNLKVELQGANAAIVAFGNERKAKERTEKDIPPVQHKILRSLPSEHSGDGLTMKRIASEGGVQIDEAEIHIHQLENRGFVEWEEDQVGQMVWRRTRAGNELVVAKRLAGEEETEQTEETAPKRKHTALLKTEEIVLLMVGRTGAKGITALEIAEKAGGGATENMMLLILSSLSAKDMATCGHAPRTPKRWVLLNDGREYLRERGFL